MPTYPRDELQVLIMSWSLKLHLPSVLPASVFLLPSQSVLQKILKAQLSSFMSRRRP